MEMDSTSAGIVEEPTRALETMDFAAMVFKLSIVARARATCLVGG
jgi:hypothetical protein